MGAVHVSDFTEQLYLVKGPGQLRVDQVKYSEDKTEVSYSYWKLPGKLVKSKLAELISFRARPLPGCCGILVVYYVRPRVVKDGPALFSATMDSIINAAKAAGYASVLMSLLETSKEALATVTGKGFSSTVPMINRKTHNGVVTLQLDLKQEPVKTKTFVVD